MKKSILFIAIFLVYLSFKANCQIPELWGLTSQGGIASLASTPYGTIFKINANGSAFNRKFTFTAEADGFTPMGHLCLANNGKYYGLTRLGGTNGINSSNGFNGVLFEYDYATGNHSNRVSFDGGNGSQPFGSLIQASNGKLYGMASGGGANSNGVLFEYDYFTDVYTKKVEFNGSNGSLPSDDLFEASNGKLYGMTSMGGANNLGVLFEFDLTSNTFTKKIDFAGAANGSNPLGSLIQAGDGKLYGMTATGGLNNLGILFQYDFVTNIFTKKLDFIGANGANRFPSSWSGSLKEASNGKLYGMTYQGGLNNLGVLFEYNYTADIYTKKLDFNGANGMLPSGSLLQASNGKLYGTTSVGGSGGTNNFDGGGVVFEYNYITDTYSKKHDFGTNSDYSATPNGGLVEVVNGKLLGMTNNGGKPNVSGNIFEYDFLSDTYTIKFDFIGGNFPNINDPDGINPLGNLMEASNGKFYGLTNNGGADFGYVLNYTSINNGVIFEYDKSTNIFTKKFTFDFTNGSAPYGSLIQAFNGKLYGTTSFGGINNSGVLFSFDPITNVFTKLFDFDDVNSGSNSHCTLIQATNNKLYGTTSYGGVNGSGVLFSFDPANNTYTKLFDFDILNSSNGFYPLGSLMQASDSKLYGMTADGGVNSGGVIYSFNITNNTFNKVFDFDPSSTGSNPIGSLTQATNGKLYGMTPNGGNASGGVLFSFVPSTNTFTKLLDFDNYNSGRSPNGSLIQASDSKLYGMTAYGGINDMGVIFSYNISSSSFLKLKDLDITTGYNPYGNLLEASPTCTISVSASPSQHMYFGYGPEQCKSNTAIVTGGTPPFTYHWSLNRALLTDVVNQSGDETMSGSNTATVTLCLLDSAQVCVTVSDANGCSSSSCANLYAEDVRCFAGNSGIHKVSMCHRTESNNNPWVQICIDTNAVSAHLALGDYVGSCIRRESTAEALEDGSNLLAVYPNPNNGIFTIAFNDAINNGTLRIFDLVGEELYKDQFSKASNEISLNVPAGIYYLQIKSRDKIYMKKIIVQ